MLEEKIEESAIYVYNAVVNGDKILFKENSSKIYLLCKKNVFIKSFPSYKEMIKGKYICCTVSKSIEDFQNIKKEEISSIKKTLNTEKDLWKYISKIKVLKYNFKKVSFTV